MRDRALERRVANQCYINAAFNGDRCAGICPSNDLGFKHIVCSSIRHFGVFHYTRCYVCELPDNLEPIFEEV
jgi:hypothetical protein